MVGIEVDGKVMWLPLADIGEARLVLNDELIRASLTREKQKHKEQTSAGA
jgi:hypothetical protein